MNPRSRLRSLPSVDRVMNSNPLRELSQTVPKRLLLQGIRETLDSLRARLRDGEDINENELSVEAIAERACKRITALAAPSLRRVVNATGVILHTGLGRAVLPEAARNALNEMASGHCNLEIDTKTGVRGSRAAHYQQILASVCGAEWGLAVNNNAAAVFLALNTLASGKEVIVSRGELVEIGGSFRMPDIMTRAGVKLVEVGTTNRTRISDYEQAITEDTALILRVYTSNFRVVGFTESAPLTELVELGRKYMIPVMYDVGSGALIDLGPFGLSGEPIVCDVLKAGVDVVTFSGDKLLGGPQAGLIVGRKHLVEAMQNNPLARTFRLCKLTIAALEATLRLYLDPESIFSRIPSLCYIAKTLPTIEQQARRLRRGLLRALGSGFKVEVIDGFSEVGGGALPGEQMPTKLVAISSDAIDASEIAARFRNANPVVFGRVANEKFLLDVRTISDSELKQIEKVAYQILAV